MIKRTFEVSRVSGMPVSDSELIADLLRVASQLGKSTVGQKEYGRLGRYDYSTAIRRFGSWNKALLAAGLSLSHEVNISDDRLFENLLVLWQHFGRQPRRAELSREPSVISQGPYRRRFKSWTAALHEFVEYANATEEGSSEACHVADQPVTHKGPRDSSLRQRWKVLQRDRFSCRGCGASPALTAGVELHVDHIIPWSKGGKTEIDNLQTLCSSCNFGKSDEIPS
jgi:hypothetical protein